METILGILAIVLLCIYALTFCIKQADECDKKYSGDTKTCVPRKFKMEIPPMTIEKKVIMSEYEAWKLINAKNADERWYDLPGSIIPLEKNDKSEYEAWKLTDANIRWYECPLPKSLKKKDRSEYSNCRNCGAPKWGDKCDYCQTKY